jgi:hypothetical protein
MCVSRKSREKQRAFFSISDPLAVVESYLGSIERGPSSLIMDMFVDEPKAAVIKRVAALMYGNYVTVSDAVDCYNSCNGMLRSYVDRSPKTWYHLWDRDKNKIQKERYYSMLLKSLLWINGKALDQCEVKKPALAMSSFGPKGTPRPLLIGAIDYIHRGGDDIE